MRNFGDKFIFEKKISILNTGEGVALAKLASVNKVSAVTSATATQNPAANSEILFFPEGGSLIEGATSMVAFKTESLTGNGMAATGNILSATGSTVAAFSCDSLGMGTLMLDVAVGEKYTAKGTFANGAAFNTPLPAAMASGFSLFVRSTDSLLKVSISTNQVTLNQQQEKPLLLTVKSKGATAYSAQIPMQGLQVAFTIPKAGIPMGISAITLYDASGKPQCERLVYIDGTEQVKLSISTDQPVYSPKGKVTVTVKATNQHNLPVKANLSLAAVDANLIPANIENIATYLNLSSEIKGDIEHPQQYLDPKNPNRKQQLDLLLLTQGWRDFLWKRLADSALHISYPAEEGITVSGKVREVTKDKPLAGVNITMRAPGAAGNKIFGAATDSAGRYFIDGVVMYGQQNIRLSSHDSKGEAKGMILLDSLFREPPAVNRSILPIAAGQSTTAPINEKNVIERSVAAHKISLTDTTHLKEVKIKADKYIRLNDETVSLLGYPDEVYNVEAKDYDMTDLFHYLQFYSKAEVGDVGFADGGSELRPLKLGEVPPPDSQTIYFKLLYYHGSRGVNIFPRLIINGRELVYSERAGDVRQMADYQQTYFSLPVNKVKKVVIKRAIGPPQVTLSAKAGSSTFSGPNDVYIIYLTLEPGAVASPWPDKIAADVNGYYQARTFYAPQYAGRSTKTDLRTTIHWEPNIATNQNGEATITYYNADPKTAVRIVAEGISVSGLPVSGTAVYEVK